MIVEVLIVESCTLKRERTREHKAFAGQKHVSGLYHSVQHSIEVHAVAHWLSNYDIHFDIELIPRHHLDKLLQLVFFDNLPHHVDILHLPLALSIYHAIDFFTASLHCKERVKAVDSFSQVQHILPCEQMLIIYH